MAVAYVCLRLPGPDAALIVARLSDGIENAEWLIPGQIVADIGLERPPSEQGDGSIILNIEALTIAE